MGGGNASLSELASLLELSTADELSDASVEEVSLSLSTDAASSSSLPWSMATSHKIPYAAASAAADRASLPNRPRGMGRLGGTEGGAALAVGLTTDTKTALSSPSLTAETTLSVSCSDKYAGRRDDMAHLWVSNHFGVMSA